MAGFGNDDYRPAPQQYNDGQLVMPTYQGPADDYRASGTLDGLGAGSPQTMSAFNLPQIGAPRLYGNDWGLNAQLDPSWVRRLYQWQQGPMTSIFGG